MKKEVRGRRPHGSSRDVARALVGIGLLAATAEAQSLQRPRAEAVVLQGGTIHVGNGDVIEGGSVILKGSRIDAVGKGLEIPEGARVVDVTGRHVYPGLIDAESGLMLEPHTSFTGEGQPTASAADAIDPYQTHERAEAWAGGVTSVYVETHRGLFDGAGVLLKLRGAGGGADLVLKKDFAVSATFGSEGDRPSILLREWKQFEEKLTATKKYIESWEEYDEKLGEYKKALEKMKKEGDTKIDKDAAKKPAAPESRPAPAPGPGGPPVGPRGRRRRPGGSLLPFILDELNALGEPLPADLHLTDHDGDDGEDPHDCTKEPDPLNWTDGVSYADDAPSEDKDGAAKKEDAKKPPRPDRDRDLDTLRRLFDGKLSLRVQAMHAADLQNLLELRGRFPIDLAVTGAADALKLAPELAEARIPVVFALAADAAPDVASVPARLAAAHVDFALTADDPGASSTRFLALVGATAVAGGLDREAALSAISSSPARILGVGDRLGTLEAGKDADVVVTRGELFSSSMVVEQVFVDGRAVLSR